MLTTPSTGPDSNDKPFMCKSTWLDSALSWMTVPNHSKTQKTLAISTGQIWSLRIIITLVIRTQVRNQIHQVFVYDLSYTELICWVWFLSQVWSCHNHYVGMSENGVYPQWNSHLVGIMISKTIGCRGLAYFQTNPCQNSPGSLSLPSVILSLLDRGLAAAASLVVLVSTIAANSHGANLEGLAVGSQLLCYLQFAHWVVMWPHLSKKSFSEPGICPNDQIPNLIFFF